MRFLIYITAFIILFAKPSSALNYSENHIKSDLIYQKPDLAQTPKGEYILHKDKIDSEILILKEKYPELTNEIISYKFLYAPIMGRKQFFESDGGLFDLIKRYSRSTKPGDIINITEVAYKDSHDSAAVWKKFNSRLHFIYQ